MRLTTTIGMRILFPLWYQLTAWCVSDDDGSCWQQNPICQKHHAKEGEVRCCWQLGVCASSTGRLCNFLQTQWHNPESWASRDILISWFQILSLRWMLDDGRARGSCNVTTKILGARAFTVRLPCVRVAVVLCWSSPPATINVRSSNLNLTLLDLLT